MSVVRRSLSAASNGTANATAAIVVAAAAAASAPWLVEKLEDAFGDSLWRDAVAFLVSSVGAYVHVKMFDVLVAKGLIDVNLSRKLIHVTSGSTFILTWVLFRRGPVVEKSFIVFDFERQLRLLLERGTGSEALKPGMSPRPTSGARSTSGAARVFAQGGKWGRLPPRLMSGTLEKLKQLSLSLSFWLLFSHRIVFGI